MNAPKRIAIRVDASIAMGMGHVVRCISLANRLAEHGAQVVFLMRSQAAGLVSFVQANGHRVSLLPDPPEIAVTSSWLPTTWQNDAEQVRAVIAGLGSVDWLVVDQYGLDAGWERSQRSGVSRILAIDDVADRSHDCDMLLDQNLVAEMGMRYKGLVPADCQLFLGPTFALLRPAFAEQRQRLARHCGNVNRILVCFGGSDPSNQTAKALAAIKTLSARSFAVDVVTGLSNPHRESVAAACKQMARAELHHGADDIAALMARADLSIGAGGIMNWERCCLGLPSIAVDIADNQVGGLKGLAAAGGLEYLGSAAAVSTELMARSIDQLAGSPERLQAMSEVAYGLVDGEGCRRVAEAMV